MIDALRLIDTHGPIVKPQFSRQAAAGSESGS